MRFGEVKTGTWEPQMRILKRDPAHQLCLAQIHHECFDLVCVLSQTQTSSQFWTIISGVGRDQWAPFCDHGTCERDLLPAAKLVFLATVIDPFHLSGTRLGSAHPRHSVNSFQSSTIRRTGCSPLGSHPVTIVRCCASV